MAIYLTGSVGQNGDNAPEDVEKVQKALRDLGYTMVGPVDGWAGPRTIKAIKMFQSAIFGLQPLGGDGRVDAEYWTHAWLNARNAPRWVKLPKKGAGFVNVEVDPKKRELHGFMTSWLKDAIVAAGAHYKRDHYDRIASSSLLTVDDVSLHSGGDKPKSGAHEVGISCDVRVPIIGYTDAAPIGRSYRDYDYDRKAARSILIALWVQKLADRDQIFFNDPELINEKLCVYKPGHDRHIHFEVTAPDLEY
jgi:hypothetical protein